MKKYVKASFDNPIPDWLKNSKGALSALNRAGIDLKSMAISDSPSGRGKDYPIYLVSDNGYKFVWIPNVYNDAQYIYNPASGRLEAIKYVAKKNVPVVDVVYLSKSDYNKAKKDHYKDPRYNYDFGDAKYAGQQRDERRGGWKSSLNKYNERRDKSGYIIPSPDEKLVSFYSKGSGDSSRLGDRIRRLYDKLIDVKSQIFDLDFTDFGKDSEGNPDWYSTSYENILSQFGDSCRDYKIALRSLSKMGDDISGHDYRIRDILDRVKSAEDKIKRIEKALSTQRYW